MPRAAECEGHPVAYGAIVAHSRRCRARLRSQCPRRSRALQVRPRRRRRLCPRPPHHRQPPQPPAPPTATPCVGGSSRRRLPARRGGLSAPPLSTRGGDSWPRPAECLGRQSAPRWWWCPSRRHGRHSHRGRVWGWRQRQRHCARCRHDRVAGHARYDLLVAEAAAGRADAPCSSAHTAPRVRGARAAPPRPVSPGPRRAREPCR